MGVLSMIFKLIFFPFYIFRNIFTTKQYRIYLDQKQEMHNQIREINKTRHGVEREKEPDPEKFKMLDERERHLKRAVKELRKTYISQSRLEKKPTSMHRFRMEKRREKKLRKVAGKLD